MTLSRVGRDELLKGLKDDHWTLPTIPDAPGRGIALHEALCVAYANQMHRGTRTTLIYAARPITDQNVRDFLTGRGVIVSVFERYAIVDSNGGQINVRSHGFRHFLNHLLDEGGAPDLVQTKWFGRKHAADTKAYQHLTPAQKAEKIVADIMGGQISGAVTEIAKVLPVEVAQTFLAARIHAVHDVGPGLCIHDFQMSPCPRHLQCTVNCDEYIWLKQDASRSDELKRQAAVAYVSLQNVRMQIDGQALVEANWMRHLRIRYEQLMTQLATLDFDEADLVRYIDEGGAAMPKTIRANSKISTVKMAGIIAELERWRDRELGLKLTWDKVEAFSGFTRQAMSRHPEILNAYQEAKRSLSTPGRRSQSRSYNDERAYFDRTLEALRSEVRRYEALEQAWLQRWQRIAFHCSRRGLRISDLDRPLDDPGRGLAADSGKQASLHAKSK